MPKIPQEIGSSRLGRWRCRWVEERPQSGASATLLIGRATVCFGRHAAKQLEWRGEGSPKHSTSSHAVSKQRSFVIGRKPIKKRMQAELLAIKIELRHPLQS
jgi:hypothetical protein